MTSSMQAGWLVGLSSGLLSLVPSYFKERQQIDAKFALKMLIDKMRGSKDENINWYIDGLQKLMKDSEFDTILHEFERGLQGSKNLKTIGKCECLKVVLSPQFDIDQQRK